MGALGTYYIDAENLTEATAVYTSSAMTTAAADGYYSDGSVVRLQTSGVLGIILECPTCTTYCGYSINRLGNQALYTVGFNTLADVGCTIIYFRPTTRPHGVRATHYGITYNEFTSTAYGYLASTDPSSYSYVGDTAEDCGIGAALGGGGYSGVDEYSFDGTTFNLDGTAGVVTGTAADVVTTATNPAYCTLYIPKSIPNPADMVVEIFSPCVTAEFDIDINCPTLLTGIPTSVINHIDACTVTTLSNTYYNVPNKGGTAGIPQVNEFLVTDPYGNARASAGNYTIEVSGIRYQIVVSSDGIITSIGSCP